MRNLIGLLIFSVFFGTSPLSAKDKKCLKYKNTENVCTGQKISLSFPNPGDSINYVDATVNKVNDDGSINYVYSTGENAGPHSLAELKLVHKVKCIKNVCAGQSIKIQQSTPDGDKVYQVKVKQVYDDEGVTLIYPDGKSTSVLISNIVLAQDPTVEDAKSKDAGAGPSKSETTPKAEHSEKLAQ